MRITIGNTTKEAMNLLEILEYPFSEQELKSKFRKALKEKHQDLTGDKDGHRKVIEAFKHLENLAMSSDIKSESDYENEEIAQRRKEQDEDSLGIYDTCKVCKGIGKRIIEGYIYSAECPDCDRYNFQFSFSWMRKASGFKTLPCHPCKGTGQYTQRNGRKVLCTRCYGKGKFVVKCKTCKGKGEIEKKTESQEFLCKNCKGTGRVKLELWNPVLKKGAMR